MKKENIENKLTAEIELFKIFSYYLIALIAGISTIIISKAYTDKYVLFLLLLGIFSFLIVFTHCIIYYFKIRKLKNLL